MAEFERRLSKSRSSRPEYLRIQAHSLASAGHHAEAINLLDRLLAEQPDYFLQAWVYEHRAGSLAKSGRPQEAIEDYRKSIDAMKAHPGVQGNAPLSFAALAYDLHLTDLYEEILGHLADFWDPNPLFPVHEFKQFGYTALLLNALGRRDDAKPPARRALAAAVRGRSNAANHRNLGLVQDGGGRIRKELEQIVGGSPFPPQSGGVRSLMDKVRRLIGQLPGPKLPSG